MIQIFHGMGSNPDRAWIPWLKSQLESDGHSVSTPRLPNSKFPNKDEWDTTLNQVLNETDIIVGYSLSSHNILNHIAKNKTKGDIYLVAPFGNIDQNKVYDQTMKMLSGSKLPTHIKHNYSSGTVKHLESWCEEPLPWEELRDVQERLHLIFSDYDSYTTNQIALFESMLPNTDVHVVERAGHFTTNDGYKTFPHLYDCILNNLNK